MSAPVAKSSQGPRRSPRRHKSDALSIDDQSKAFNSDASPSRPAARSAYSNPSHVNGIDTKGQASAPRRKSQGSKKHNNASQTSRNPSYAQQSSQTNLISPERKTTPLKQAYAGPTFHSSPAASSLPLPSFYSKSLPTVTASPPPASTFQLDGQANAEVSPPSTSTTQLDGQASADSDAETLVPIRSEDSAIKAREPSTLDFMFEAARRARSSPRGQSPDFRAGRLSPFDDAPKNGSRTPGESSSDLVFPLELEGNGRRFLPIGPAFSTPYKERMEALRASKAQSVTSPQTMDEKERKEKGDALKRLLINASPLRSPQRSDTNNYFVDRAPESQTASQNYQLRRHHSGPSTPYSGNLYASTTSQNLQNIQNMPASTLERDLPIPRPISSRLRREYQPDNQHSPAELDSGSATPPQMLTAQQDNRRSVTGQTVHNFAECNPYSTTTSKMQASSSYSAQKLEDDLRRVLKLDLASSN